MNAIFLYLPEGKGASVKQGGFFLQVLGTVGFHGFSFFRAEKQNCIFLNHRTWSSSFLFSCSLSGAFVPSVRVGSSSFDGSVKPFSSVSCGSVCSWRLSVCISGLLRSWELLFAGEGCCAIVFSFSLHLQEPHPLFFFTFLFLFWPHAMHKKSMVKCSRGAAF